MISSAVPTGAGYDGRGDDSRMVLATLVTQHLIRARAAQAKWSIAAISKRLNVTRKFRELLAENAQSLCEMASRIQNRPQSEILTSEMGRAENSRPAVFQKKVYPLSTMRKSSQRRIGDIGAGPGGLAAAVHCSAQRKEIKKKIYAK